MIEKMIINFDHVILFALQQKLNEGNNRPEMSFGEIWRVCAAAGKNFTLPIDADRERKLFAARMIEDINRLALSEWITVQTDGRFKIHSITLTNSGIDYLNEVVFTNQSIMQEL